MKRIFTIATAILLVSTLLMTLTSCGGSDTSDETVEVYSTEEAEYTQSAVNVGKTSEEVLAYFNSLVNGVKADKPIVYYSIEKNVPNGYSVIITASENTFSITNINNISRADVTIFINN